jgi:hypothetical protein
MSQYDAAAIPMWNCFSATANHPSFKAVAPQVDLREKNVAVNEWQRRSEQFDLSKEDNVPDLEFNIVLWNGLKGTPFPAPKRAAFVNLLKKDDKDDD